MLCEHNFQYQNVVYYSGHQLPGSGAHERIYADRYYCTKCLEQVDKNPRTKGNTYEKPIEGTYPA